MPNDSVQPRSEEPTNTRLTRSNGPLGTSVPPKRIKDVEMDDGRHIRVNPFWVPLEEIPREAILNGRPGAVWHYSAVLSEEADNPGVLRYRVMLGSEELLTVMGRMDFLKLLGGLRKGALKQQRENPESAIEYPTQEGLKKSIDGLGHPTIAVDFKPNGMTKEGKAAVSGEFRYAPDLKLGTANDKSGRYMSEKARPARGDRDPGKIAEWGKMVAKSFSDHLDVSVAFEQIKTLSNPVAGHAAMLSSTIGRPNSSTARQARRPQTDPAAKGPNKRRR